MTETASLTITGTLAEIRAAIGAGSAMPGTGTGGTGTPPGPTGATGGNGTGGGTIIPPPPPPGPITPPAPPVPIVTPPVTVTPPTPVATGPIDYFPADPGRAPFPSPENSSISSIGPDVGGKAYLRDLNGSFHTLHVPVAGAMAPNDGGPDTGYSINGDICPVAGALRAHQLVIRGGVVYAQMEGGGWCTSHMGMGNIMYSAQPPAAGNTAPGPALADPANDPNFPANALNAPSPSPENSTSLSIAGKLMGEPYIRDADGGVHKLHVSTGPGDVGYTANGDPVPISGNLVVNQILLRGGKVYAKESGGGWSSNHAGMGYIQYGASLPAALLTAPTTGGGTTTAPPPGPAAPPPMPPAGAIAPGSNGNVVQAATLDALSAAITAAKDGDKIVLAKGTYKGVLPSMLVALHLDLQGSTIDATGQTGLARGKGLFVPCADAIIENGEVFGVAMTEPFGGMTSAIRPDFGCSRLTVRNMRLHDNQCGIGHGGPDIVITVEDSNVSNNGLKANTGSLTHNMYIGEACRLLNLIRVICDNPTEAHAVKYRGKELRVEDGMYGSGKGKPFDLPNELAVASTIKGAHIIKRAGDWDHGLVGLGEEGASNGNATLTFDTCNIEALCENPFMVGASGCTVVIKPNCTVTGNPITAAGGLSIARAA